VTVDEISARLRARLQEEYGVDEAAILMDRPPGGWGDLVTNQSLDRRLGDFSARIDAKFETVDARFGELKHELTSTMEREIRAQTWRLVTAMFSAMTLLVAIAAVVVAIFAKT
jgi:hypothetical protein